MEGGGGDGGSAGQAGHRHLKLGRFRLQLFLLMISLFVVHFIVKTGSGEASNCHLKVCGLQLFPFDEISLYCPFNCQNRVRPGWPLSPESRSLS